MSQGLRKLTAAISKSNCIVIFINQIREKIGVMFGLKTIFILRDGRIKMPEKIWKSCKIIVL